MSQKLALSKSGYDIVTNTDPRNLVFSSEYPPLLIIGETTVTKELPADGEVTQSVSFSSSLGFTPAVCAFFKYSDDSPIYTYFQGELYTPETWNRRYNYLRVSPSGITIIFNNVGRGAATATVKLFVTNKSL